MDKPTFKRVPFRIQQIDDKAILWIDAAHMDVIEATMPGVITADETDRSLDMVVHTREFECVLDPLAETPDVAIQALTAYLNEAIGFTSPASAQAELLAGGDTNLPQPIPTEV